MGAQAAPIFFIGAVYAERARRIRLSSGNDAAGRSRFPIPHSRPPARMNQPLRDRIARRLESLSDERLYQVLDYVEFLESKYADKTAQSPNVFQRFAEGVEDSLRAGRVSAATIADTMSLLNKAMGVLSGVAAAGRSVATDVVEAASRTATRSGGDRAAPPPAPPAPTTQSPGGSSQ